MRFGFFKKKGDGNARKDSDLFDPTHDALDFDELEESGEFLADDSGDPTPGPPAYQPPPPPPPKPQQQAPRQPAPLPPAPGPSKLPPGGTSAAGYAAARPVGTAGLRRSDDDQSTTTGAEGQCPAGSAAGATAGSETSGAACPSGTSFATGYAADAAAPRGR